MNIFFEIIFLFYRWYSTRKDESLRSIAYFHSLGTFILTLLVNVLSILVLFNVFDFRVYYSFWLSLSSTSKTVYYIIIMILFAFVIFLFKFMIPKQKILAVNDGLEDRDIDYTPLIIYLVVTFGLFFLSVYIYHHRA